MKGKYIKYVISTIGESIEEKIRKARTQGVKIDSVAPVIYTAKKEGVKPEYDVRTDRQEIALDAINKYQGSEQFKNMELNEEMNNETEETKTD